MSARDPVRLLHRRSHHGYTSDPAKALFAEPEAVPAGVQERMTRAVRRSEREAQLAQWREHRDEIKKRLDWLYSQRLRQDVRQQLRRLQRQLDGLDKKIAAG